METSQASKLSDSRSKWQSPPRRSQTDSPTTRYQLKNFSRAYRSWLLPYIKSRLRPGAFRPVLSFLFTDINCNLSCHYCYSKGKKIPGMTMEMAKDAVDWLQTVGCKVLAYMGGEPLVRKDFIIELTRYAKEKGFFIYLPTNGILMDKAFIDEIGKAGVAAINLAVDSVDGYDGIPKALRRIQSNFEYLVRQQKKYGYLTFFNINITQKNIGDVKALTETAHKNGIGTDYHINEPPIIDYDSFEDLQDGAWITEKDVQAVDEVIDWLIEKNRQGYAMVNSLDHLQAMKRFIRHEGPPWSCRAGELSMIIRLDGSFAPCFELYGAEENWGNIYGGPQFDLAKLRNQKKECSPHCLSTCNYQINHYTRGMLYSLQWVAKHTYGNFLGTS